MRKYIFLSGLAALTACASAGDHYEMSDKAAAQLAAYDRTGDVERCLNVSSISHITPIDEKHLLVRVGAGKFYLNEVAGACKDAEWSGNRLQYKVTGSQLCKNDIIHVVDNSGGFFVSSCSLNDFERLEKHKAD